MPFFFFLLLHRKNPASLLDRTDRTTSREFQFICVVSKIRHIFFLKDTFFILLKYFFQLLNSNHARHLKTVFRHDLTRHSAQFTCLICRSKAFKGNQAEVVLNFRASRLAFTSVLTFFFTFCFTSFTRLFRFNAPIFYSCVI